MILTQADLFAHRAEWRQQGRRVVFTNGCFDLLHLGHVAYLEEARSLGDLLVLGLNSDASVHHLKGPTRPLVGQEARARVMDALRPVDYVTIFEEYTAEKLVSQLQPDIYVKGGDYGPNGAGQAKPLPEAAIVEAYGGRVALIPFLPGYSTTELIHKILVTYAPKS